MEQYLIIFANNSIEFDEKYRSRVFFDSEMQKTSELLQVAIMEINYVLGMQHRKIGAKTTMEFEPMDLGEFCKCITSKTIPTHKGQITLVEK